MGGEFVYDDHSLIEQNELLREPGRLGEALTTEFWNIPASDVLSAERNRYYRPVVTLAYFVQFRVFGEASWGYHLVSVALHLSCVLLAFFWLRRRLAGRPAAVAASAAGAAVFALHPSRAESVAWIAGSTDLWMALFVLLGLTAWDRLRGAARVGWTAAAFVVAMLAKETAVVAPLLLVTDGWLLPEDRAERPARVRRAGFVFGLVASAFGLRLWLAPGLGGGEEVEGLVESGKRVAASLGHFLALVVRPWGATMSEACLTSGTGSGYAGWAVALGTLGLVGFVAVLVAAGRRAGGRPWLADLLWFVLPLTPALNVVPLGLPNLVSQRFLYLGMLGLGALSARLLSARWTVRAWARRVPWVGLGVLLPAWSVELVAQVASFRDDVALWTRAHEADPRDACAARQLAGIQIAAARYGDALATLERTGVFGQGRPEYYDTGLVFRAAQAALGATPDSHGDVLVRLREFYDALAEGRDAGFREYGLRVSIRGDPAVRKKAWSDVDGFRVPRAVAHARTGETKAAVEQLREVVAEAPRSFGAWTALVQVLAWSGRWEEAAAATEEARRAGLAGRRLDELAGDVGRVVAWLRSERAAESPVRTVLVVADGLLRLQAPGLARQRLAPEFLREPVDPEVVQLLVAAEVLDGDPEGAHDVLVEARRRDPGRTAVWDEVERGLEEALRISRGRRWMPGRAPEGMP